MTTKLPKMTNNDIFKKLRVALQLRDDQIIEILELVDFRVSKGELGNVFRKEDHADYMECGDQLLRNFLNGLVIHLRGTKENPKNPTEVLNAHKEKVKATIAATSPDKKEFKPKFDKPKFDKPKEKTTKSGKKYTPKDSKDSKPKSVIDNFRYTSGKDKKSK